MLIKVIRSFFIVTYFSQRLTSIYANTINEHFSIDIIPVTIKMPQVVRESTDHLISENFKATKDILKSKNFSTTLLLTPYIFSLVKKTNFYKHNNTRARLIVDLTKINFCEKASSQVQNISFSTPNITFNFSTNMKKYFNFSLFSNINSDKIFNNINTNNIVNNILDTFKNNSTIVTFSCNRKFKSITARLFSDLGWINDCYLNDSSIKKIFIFTIGINFTILNGISLTFMPIGEYIQKINTQTVNSNSSDNKQQTSAWKDLIPLKRPKTMFNGIFTLFGNDYTQREYYRNIMDSLITINNIVEHLDTK